MSVATPAEGGALVLPEHVSVPRADTAFDDMDELVDPRAAAALKQAVQRLIEMARLMA